MGVAGDCTYVANYGGTQEALKQILSDWNQASALYESTFNVALKVVALKLATVCGDTNEIPALTWNKDCTSSYTINRRLSDFSYWRDKKSADKAGLWHLMTKCKYFLLSNY
jgi:Mlc titration factor MtfA (ptsG expression regulator)